MSGSIGGHPVSVAGRGGESISGGHTPGSISDCECASLQSSQVELELSPGETLTASIGKYNATWIVPEQSVTLSFPDGYPVPGGGRVEIRTSSTISARLDLAATVELMDGSSREIGLIQGIEAGKSISTWQVPDAMTVRAGLHTAILRFEATDTCQGPSSCSVSSVIQLSLDIEFG